MIAFENLASVIEHPRLKQWLASSQLQQSHSQQLETHGKWKNWCAALSQLSTLNHHSFKLNADNAIVKVGNTDSLTGQQQNILRETLKQFHPWRKGPFEICGVLIDSEWRSNLKWDRLINSIQPLKNRVILDVGCGNGYFGWRMLAQGAQLIVGIDPFPLYVAQFHAISQFAGLHPH
nr:DUF1698 domain-containing protein [Gammaproteobacteria bacterium]